MFQSYWNAVIGAPSAPPRLMADFWSMPTVLLEWVALDVLHQGEVEGDERHDPAGWSWL